MVYQVYLPGTVVLSLRCVGVCSFEINNFSNNDTPNWLWAEEIRGEWGNISIGQ